MEERSRKVPKASTYVLRNEQSKENREGESGYSGAMEEMAWKVQKASTYIGGSVVIDIAPCEGCCSTSDSYSSTLSKRGKEMSGKLLPPGSV